MNLITYVNRALKKNWGGGKRGEDADKTERGG